MMCRVLPPCRTERALQAFPPGRVAPALLLISEQPRLGLAVWRGVRWTSILVSFHFLPVGVIFISRLVVYAVARVKERMTSNRSAVSSHTKGGNIETARCEALKYQESVNG